MGQVKLVCEDVKFYSQLDESAFFDWKDRIQCITSFEGLGNKMFLIIDNDKITDDCVREILGLFYRYGISMGQLKKLLTDENKDWFFNPDMDWFDRVFKE